jgi:formaldehyde-activating enzyme
MADVRPGHAPLLLCLGAGNLVRPATVVRNKTTIDSEHVGLLTWGAAQLGIGQGVCDAVDEGLIPLEHVDDLVLLVAVYVDPEGNDHTALRKANRLATRNAIADALQADHCESARTLIAGREDARNRFYRGE